jgi:hypothetical protein
LQTAENFRFSKLLVIESLESQELSTGQITADFVRSIEQAAQLGISVELIRVSYAREFSDLLKHLSAEAQSTGQVPLLHVECHGDKDLGLEFSNGSMLSWPDFSRQLASLNLATRFNLVCVFSACYGGYLLSQLSTVEPAPFLAMIAPSDELMPDEILAAFRVFYTTLFSQRDAGAAVDAISKLRLIQGYWFGQHAELWFERVTVSYVKDQCTEAAMRERVQRLYRRLLSEGNRQSIGSLKRALQKANRTGLLGELFADYFMTAQLPENNERFARAKNRVEHELAKLRATGKYYV